MHLSDLAYALQPMNLSLCGNTGVMNSFNFCFLLVLVSIVSMSKGLDRSDFPPDFMFGTASSAYQYEGAWREGGKGLSIWDAFTHSPGNVKDGSNGDVADDQFHKYLEDIELMASLGVDSYRFSISWSRILPDGNGEVNQAGIEYYNNFINALLRNGIQPFVTLFHFDLPNALEESYSGWLSPQIITDFEAYADICFKAFGDRVKYWATMNEPNLFVPLGYTAGLFPPTRCSLPFGKCDSGNSMSEPYVVAHNVLLAHAAAVNTYRTKYQKKIEGGSIGFVMSAPWYEPLENTADDRAAVDRIVAFNIRWFLDPIVLGNYPSEMRERLGSRLPALSGKVAGSFDFIGLNQYTTLYATSAPIPSLDSTTHFYPDSMVYLTGERQGIHIGEPTGMGGLYVVPRGMQSMVEYVTQVYNKPPIFITENGYAESRDSSVTLQEALEDVRRIHFHSDNLNHLAKAIRNGSDVRGYFMWSLLDNFEWRFGYTMRFGLYYVDMHSQNRYPKKSAQWCDSGNSMSEPYVAAHNALLAHAAAVNTYRTKYQKIQGGSIGFVICATWYEPFEVTADDISAVDRILAFSVRWFLDPIVLGDYPSEMREGLGLRLPAFDSEMSENLAGSFDFIGINQYTTLYASASPTPSLDATTRFYPDSMVYLTGERRGIPIGEPTGMGGLYVVPRGIQSMVEYVTQIYNRPPVIITENGYESKNSFAKLQEALEDVRRIHFHSDNLNHLAKAIRNGSDVRGYFMWSLLDNFEWRFGYTMRFGLYYVDMHSQNRYPKKSAQWVKQLLQKDIKSSTI